VRAMPCVDLLTHDPSFDISRPDCGKLLLSESCFYIVSLLVSKRHEHNNLLLVREFFSLFLFARVKARMNREGIVEFMRERCTQKTTLGATTSRIHTSERLCSFASIRFYRYIPASARGLAGTESLVYRG
jgi:hypothetical protein